MRKRVLYLLRNVRERLQAKRLERLKARYMQHYREYVECNEVARDLGRMAALKRAYAKDAAREVGEDHQAVQDATREALMFSQQSQQEYEAADFHYAAYIEAREAFNQSRNQQD